MKPIFIYDENGDILPITTGGINTQYNNPVPINPSLPQNPTDQLPPNTQQNNSNQNPSGSNTPISPILIIAGLAILYFALD